MTTSAEIIRDAQASLISAKPPLALAGTKFREFDKPGDFRQWSEENTTACLRRFQITDLMTYEPPLVADYSKEEARTTFELVIAYPDDNRYGGEEYNGISDVISYDRRLVDTEIGLHAVANYVSGQSSSILVGTDIEVADGARFLVMEYEIIFYQASLFTSIDIGA